MPAFFANLIPEGELRELLEQRLGIPEDDDLAFLAAVCSDLPGAVTLRTTAWESDDPGGSGAAIGEPDGHGYEHPSGGLRFSLAGVQLKLSMLREADKLTLPVRGQHGHWIIKFDAERYPGLPENEYSMLEWARRAGFDVPECHLHRLEDVLDPPIAPYVTRGSVFAIKRYDRDGAVRIHQEDFAQVKRFSDIDARAFDRLADRTGADRTVISSIVRDTLRDLAQAWMDIGGELPLWDEHRRSLIEHWRKVPLLAMFDRLG